MKGRVMAALADGTVAVFHRASGIHKILSLLPSFKIFLVTND